MTTILKEIAHKAWNEVCSSEIQAQAITALESGHILLLPQLTFALLPHEQKFLSPEFAHPKAKNISFNVHTDQLRCNSCSTDNFSALKIMIARFSQCAYQLVQQLLIPYTDAIEMGRTSLRVVEIAGRVSSYRKDDTRLHVDAFPATPNQGRRILRVFTNINPVGIDRIWRVGESFDNVAQRFCHVVPGQQKFYARLLKYFKVTKSYRTEYDHIMLHIHDAMKADVNYQQSVQQTEVRFSPNTTWIVQTDHVSHAAMAGQHVLEQTFYVPVGAMINESLSPLRVLENLYGRSLT
jgi:hypothetical protein